MTSDPLPSPLNLEFGLLSRKKICDTNQITLVSFKNIDIWLCYGLNLGCFRQYFSLITLMLSKSLIINLSHGYRFGSLDNLYHPPWWEGRYSRQWSVGRPVTGHGGNSFDYLIAGTVDNGRYRRRCLRFIKLFKIY